MNNFARAPLSRALVTTLACGLLLGLTGCNRNPVSVEHKPSPLPQLTATPVTLVPLWQARAGSGNAKDPLALQPGVSNKQIVTASRGGDVQAWSRTGQSQWRVSLKQPISGGVALDGADVALGTPSGQLLLLDATSGKTRWSRAINASILSMPLITSNRVIVLANDGSVTGVDRGTGQVVWTFDTTVASVSMRGTAAPVLLDPQTVLVAGGSGRVYAIDAQTGIPRWERRVALPSGSGDTQKIIDIDGNPVVDGGQMFVASYQSQLLAADLNQQRVLWSVDASSLRSPAVGPDLVVVANTDGRLHAHDRQSGAPRWTQEALAWRGLSNPVWLGSHVVVGDQDGYLHLLDPASGRVIGRARSSGAILKMAVVDNQLVVQTATGQVSLWQVRA